MKKVKIEKKIVEKKRIHPVAVLGIILGSFYILMWIGMFVFMFLVFDKLEGNKITENNNTIFINDDFAIPKDMTTYCECYDNNFYIIGEIKNNSEQVYNDIEISFKVKDANNITLGYARDYIDGLEKGETYRFKAVYNNVDACDVKNYSIDSVDFY